MKNLLVLVTLLSFSIGGFAMYTKQGEAHLKSNGDGTFTLYCKTDVNTPCYECPNYPMCSGDRITVFGYGSYIVAIPIIENDDELPNRIIVTSESNGN